MKDGLSQIHGVEAVQPRNLFKPSSWLAKIDFINHLILFNNVLITLVSERDGGKTSFSTLLLNSLDAQIKPLFMTAKPPCDAEAMIRSVAEQLHLNHGQISVASIVSQINERRAHVLLVIDDGQHVPESLIKDMMLAIKNQGDFGFFHLCLVSDYSLVATLNALATDGFDNLIHTIELGPLSEAETRTYVLQRAMILRLIHKPLTDAQFKQFYQLTKGNLAKINSNLESYLFKCATAKQSHSNIGIKKIAATVGVVACLAMGAFAYLNVWQKGVSPANLIAPVAKNTASTRPLASTIASWQDSSKIQLVQNALPKKQILDDLDLEEESISSHAVLDKVVVIPTVRSSVERILPVEIVQVSQPQPVLESQLVSFASSEKPAVVKNSVIKNKVIPNGYTIQLVASHRASDLVRFKESNQLFANTKIRHFTNAKGNWYILTIGEYSTRSEAQQQTKKLPERLAKLNPWVRALSTVLG